jgi:heme oxygenase
MKTENQFTLHDVLKVQTMELHKKAHELPYIANLLNNDIPLISYVGHIRAFHTIYEALENQITKSKDLVFRNLVRDYSPKVPLLKTDLEFLKVKDNKDIRPAISYAKQVADKIKLYGETKPFRLLGFVYTLEGSLNGSSILKKHVVQTFNFHNNEGTQYFSCFDDRFIQFWEGFINQLNTKIVENQEMDEVVSGAHEIFNDLLKIYESLSLID